MNYRDVTIGIVTFKSEKVIFNCLKSIKNIRNIIILDNSNDKNLKKKNKKKISKNKVYFIKRKYWIRTWKQYNFKIMSNTLFINFKP